MNKKQIIMPTILLMGMMLLTIGSAAAANIDGQVHWANGTLCTELINSGTMEITVAGNTYDQGTPSTVLLFYDEWYLLALNFGTQISDGDVVYYNVSCGGETNTTASFTYNGGGADIRFNITLDAPTSPADLIVESITANCNGYLFGNQSNEICAKIKNDGSTAAPASHAKFDLSDGHSATVSVSALNPGENETVCIIDPTLRYAGVGVTIDVTADCNNEVYEGTTGGEANNLTSQSETVCNNGYKGKTYTGGSNITTWNTHNLTGNLVYSAGNSYYQGCSAAYGGDPDWTDYDVTWGDIGIPATVSPANVTEARLYVMYTWAKYGVVNTTGDGLTQEHLSMEFNGNPSTLDAHYWDVKDWCGTSTYPYGMFAYNVTDNISTISNTANFTNDFPGGNNVSMRGMMLVVVYEDPNEPQRLIIINEEFDMLYGGPNQCTTPDEATAWAIFNESLFSAGPISVAKLITFAPGAGPTGEGELIFIGNDTSVWYDEWTHGTPQIGVSERNIPVESLDPDYNRVGFQSSADYMEASNAFLVLTYGTPVIAIDQPEFVDPQCQFTINITVDPYNRPISAVQYDLYYNTSVVWAEWANPGPFLSQDGAATDVTVSSINNLWDVANHVGRITYAETTLAPGGSGDLPFVTDPGVLTTIHFSAIGERGTYSVMDIEDVLAADPQKQAVSLEIVDCGVTIYDNIPPVANGSTLYRFSNVASKFQCFAALCCCNSHGGLEDNSEWKGNEIVYVRWDFGDGNYGTSEGLEDCQKPHEYTSWNWNEVMEEYDPFIAYLTVRDDGEPQLSNTTELEVMVYIAGDTNGDGVVDVFDAACVGKHYGQEADNDPSLNCTLYWNDSQADEADLNNDNRVSTIDLMIVGTNWNHLAYPPYIQD